MIPDNQQALKLSPLISNLEAYDAFLFLLKTLNERYSKELRDCDDQIQTFRVQGKVQLLDEMLEIRDRVGDSLHGRPELNSPLSF